MTPHVGLRAVRVRAIHEIYVNPSPQPQKSHNLKKLNITITTQPNRLIFYQG